MPISRLVSADQQETSEEDIHLENSLRPQMFPDIIGREREKKTLKMMIKASQKDKKPLDHILFHGPPGLGKTSFAHVLANEKQVDIQVTSGPALDKQGDLAAILTGIEAGSILFIDEIHRLRKTIEEILYPAMEDGVIDIIVGKGAGAKNVRLDLNPFTIVGATTRIGLISKPLLDRFGVDFRLDFYNQQEMTELVIQKAALLNIGIDIQAATMIAARSRSTPRISVKLLKRVRDNAVANSKPQIDIEMVEDTLQLLEIDKLGLDYLDKKIVTTIIQNFSGGPVGLQALAASVAEEVDTITEVYEPFLLQQGMIVRTPRGRMATKKAYQHMGMLDLFSENVD